ncbi:MAG: amidohydrolase family protein [Phycisphaerae bacterium]|nr:amidohydrolase family protein [Phycisphaerae bacterium]
MNTVPSSDMPLYFVWRYSAVDRSFWREHLEDWVPQKIFDAHTHINDPRFRLRSPSEETRKQFWVNEVNEPISPNDAKRCHETVFPDRSVSCLAFGFPELSYDVESSNADNANHCDAFGWFSLAATRPQWSAKKINELLDRPSVVGVKPYYALISEDKTTRDKHIEASIFDYLPHHQLAVLNTRRAWVTLHVPKRDRLGHPENIAEIRRIRERYPDIILVIAHFGRCYTLAHAQESLPRLAKDRGLYFDNSAVLNPEVHRYAIETLGPKRILYGTDNPIFYMRGRRSWKGRSYVNHTNYPFHFNQNREAPAVEGTYTLFMYEALQAFRDACSQLQLSREEIESIFYTNAERLLRTVNRVNP